MSDGVNKGRLTTTGDCVMWLKICDYLLPEALPQVAVFAASPKASNIIDGDTRFALEDKLATRHRQECSQEHIRSLNRLGAQRMPPDGSLRLLADLCKRKRLLEHLLFHCLQTC